MTPRDIFTEKNIIPDQKVAPQIAQQDQQKDIFSEMGISPNTAHPSSDESYGNNILSHPLLRNLATGAARSLQNIYNLGPVSSIYGKSNFDIPKILNTPRDPGFFSLPGLAQNVGAAAMYPGAGPEGFIAKSIGAIPKVGEALSSMPITNWLARHSAAGGLYGGTQTPDHPAYGTLIGMALGPVGGAAGELAGSLVSGAANLKNRAMNYLGDYLKKYAGLAPEETAQNIAQNYTTSSGQQMPVDIGTAANLPFLSKIYHGLSYVPGSGVSAAETTLQKQLSDKAIDDVTSEITNARSANDALTQGAAKQHGDLDNQINAVSQQKDSLQGDIDQAPTKLNSLANIEDRSNISQFEKAQVKNAYKSEKKQATENYAPLQDPNVRLDKMPNNGFPNYRSVGMGLLAQKENLMNLFGRSSPLGNLLEKTLGNTKTFLDSGQDYAMPLDLMVKHSQDLGELSAKAFAAGHRNESRLIGGLDQAFYNDTAQTLRNGGRSDLADQLDTANSHYKNNVVPFWTNNVIRKTVESDYIPKGSELAEALHNPNYHKILFKLSPEAQNVALYKLMTKGKGTSSGFSNLSPEKIASRYQQIPQDAKLAIAKNNPELDSYFEHLTNALNRTKQLNQSQDYLEKQKAAIEEPNTKNLDNLEQKLQELKAEKFGIKPMMTGSQQNVLDSVLPYLKGALTGAAGTLGLLHPATFAGTVPVAFAGRQLANILRSPEMAQRYISGKQLPVEENLASSLARYLGPKLTTPVASELGTNNYGT